MIWMSDLENYDHETRQLSDLKYRDIMQIIQVLEQNVQHQFHSKSDAFETVETRSLCIIVISKISRMCNVFE